MLDPCSVSVISRVCFIGLFFIVPCTDQFVRVDLRTVSFDVPPQEVGALSMSRLTLTVEAFISYINIYLMHPLYICV